MYTSLFGSSISQFGNIELGITPPITPPYDVVFFAMA